MPLSLADTAAETLRLYRDAAALARHASPAPDMKALAQ